MNKLLKIDKKKQLSIKDQELDKNHKLTKVVKKNVKKIVENNKESKPIKVIKQVPKKDKNIKSTKQIKKSILSTKKILISGGNVVAASISMINAMQDLGISIFNELGAIREIPKDVNNATATTSIPNNNLKIK